jgi:hypothetical protein
MDNEMGPRVWEKLEITLEAANSYEIAYTEGRQRACRYEWNVRSRGLE